MNNNEMITPQGVKQFTAKYHSNANKKADIDAELQTTSDRNQWLSLLKEKSAEQHRMFEENNKLLAQYWKPVAEGTCQMDDELAQAIYDGLFELYYANVDEYPIVIGMIKPLLMYYDQKNDIEKLISLNYAAYYEREERWLRMMKSSKDELALRYAYAVLEQRQYYTEIEHLEIRQKIIIMYYNLVIVSMQQNAFTRQQRFAFVKEFMDFWNSPQVQALDGTDEECRGFVDEICLDWLAEEPDEKAASREEIDFYRKLSEKFIAKELEKDPNPYAMPLEVYVSQLYLNYYEHKMTWQEMAEELLKYYDEHSKLYSAEQPERKNQKQKEAEIYFYINIPSYFFSWQEKGHFSLEPYRDYIERFLHDIQHIWMMARNVMTQQYVDAEVVPLYMKLLAYYHQQEEQKDLLLLFMVKRHLPTYVHSVMVRELAVRLMKSIVRNRPELVIDANIPNVEAVLSHREDLLHYITECALFHDLGKTRIMEIIDTQTRNITEEEFELIKNHPGYGAEMIQSLPFLKQYYDVIIGHHKFYNGQGGYPEEFDNTKSDKRIYIDIITICDCVDAATDYLGRNYNAGKDFEQVFEELKKEKGTRYNPDLVNLLEQDSQLRADFAELTARGREEICFHAYENWKKAFGKEEEISD